MVNVVRRGPKGWDTVGYDKVSEPLKRSLRSEGLVDRSRGWLDRVDVVSWMIGCKALNAAAASKALCWPVEVGRVTACIVHWWWGISWSSGWVWGRRRGATGLLRNRVGNSLESLSDEVRSGFYGWGGCG